MPKKCAENKIKNPRTKRCVKKDGAIGRKIRGVAKKYMDTPALRRAIAKEKARGKKAFTIPKKKMKKQGTSDRTNEKQGEEIMELKKKVAKKPVVKKPVAKAKKPVAKKPVAKKPVVKKAKKPVRKRRTKKEMEEASGLLPTYETFYKTAEGKKWADKRNKYLRGEPNMTGNDAKWLSGWWDENRRRENMRNKSITEFKASADRTLEYMFGYGEFTSKARYYKNMLKPFGK